MGTVIDLEAERVEAFARDLAPVLPGRRVLSSWMKADVGDLDRWRRAVRRAGRLLGWRIRTGPSADGRRTWANSPDYEPADRHRDAGDAIEARLFTADAHGPPPRP